MCVCFVCGWQRLRMDSLTKFQKCNCNCRNHAGCEFTFVDVRGFDCRTVVFTNFFLIHKLGHKSQICAFCNEMQISKPTDMWYFTAQNSGGTIKPWQCHSQISFPSLRIERNFNWIGDRKLNRNSTLCIFPSTLFFPSAFTWLTIWIFNLFPFMKMFFNANDARGLIELHPTIHWWHHMFTQRIITIRRNVTFDEDQVFQVLKTVMLT